MSLYLLCGAVAVVWILITFRLILAMKRVGRLDRLSAGRPRPDKISVIIPARNEEKDLAASLRSILDQEGVDLEIIVVNDHSTDGTEEILEALAGTEPRIKVIHDPPLQNGWLGKCNAMQAGSSFAVGDYLLFSDADIIHDPKLFVTARQLMDDEGYDLLSFFPLFVIEPFWEHVIMPMYFFGFAKVYSSQGLEDPRSPEAVAAGAFMLVKTQVFQSIGGFEPIRSEMADDVALARVIKKHGGRVGFRLAPEWLRVRLFKNNHEAFWGTTKNVLMAVEGQIWLALPLIVLTALIFWTPVYTLAAGILESNPLFISLGLLLYVLQYASLFLTRRVMSFSPLKLLFFPLVVIVVFFCVSRAFYYYMVKGAVIWRGRMVRIRE